MISQTKNRVQAIKSKFENLQSDIITKTVTSSQLNKHNDSKYENNDGDKENIEKERDSDSSDEWFGQPNTSYLYNSDVKSSITISDSKKSLVRQSSDPGKKLHRSHAFRCDRNKKIVSPKRHGSCNGRSETIDFALKMGEKKLSKDRLRRLGNLLEDQMKKENFVLNVVGEVKEEIPILKSVPDSEVPQHILDQYAKVVKKRENDKQDAMTDSGVSSETENLEEEKSGRIKKLLCHFEKPEEKENELETKSNLQKMNDLCISTETVRLEKKNPHLILTDTLKKALKQPLPPGPPPKKPPRTFVAIPESPEKEKKDPKKMLDKLEQILKKREAQSRSQTEVQNEYDIVENDMSISIKKPKEIHYLCTELIDITQRSLPNENSNCFKSLNCAITNQSTQSLPYARLSINDRTFSNRYCSCSNDSIDRRLSTFLSNDKCKKCQINDEKQDRFKCHLNCKCESGNCRFFVDEHIYDVPNNDYQCVTVGKRGGNKYGSLNLSKSMEDIRMERDEEQKIYDIPCDVSRPATPEATSSPIPSPSTSTKSNFEKLIQNFENGTVNENKGTVNGMKDTVNNNRRHSYDIKIKKDIEITKNNEKNFHVKPDIVNENKNQNSNDIKVKKDIEQIYDAKIHIKPDIIKAVAEKHEKPIMKTLNTVQETIDDRKFNTEKPPMKPKPVFQKNKMKSFENVPEDMIPDVVKKHRRFERKDPGSPFHVFKKTNSQLDVDKENLNRLMSEIYDTVTACNMETRIGSFPTEESVTEESIKLTRSLTEKRKNYVRRVSSRVAYLEQKNRRYRHQTSICSFKSEQLDRNPYSTFRSWKSFRTSQGNLAKDNMSRRESTDSKINLTDSSGNILSMKDDFDSTDNIDVDTESIDEKAGCVDIELPFEPRDRSLFNVCLLVGMNYMTGQAYVKSVFPTQVQVPPHIENLVFPETLSSSEKEQWCVEAAGTQCYSLILTDERGERAYGYCRRVLPEGATTCLPLCYCIIGKYRAPGFYYKVLQEIESHHGSSDVEIHSILQQLFETDFPNPGEEISITYSKTNDELTNSHTNLDSSKCKTMPDMRRGRDRLSSENHCKSADISNRSAEKSDDFVHNSEKVPDFYDLENNNSPKKVILHFEGPRIKTIKRLIDPRADEDCLSTLLDCLGAGLTVKVFSALLLERKLIVMGDRLSLVSSCLEGLQAALYPLVWQQPLISCVPSQIRKAALEAPLPMLAGTLPAPPIAPHEGMLIDLTHPSKALFYQGDESTILPTNCYKTLKTALQVEAKQKDDRKMRNVLISEAFLRFFVEILGDFWRFFSMGEMAEGGFGRGGVVFDKEAFMKSAPSKQNQYFLEWFTETAMFNHFIQNMCAFYYNQQIPSKAPSSNNPMELQKTPSSSIEKQLHRTPSTGSMKVTSSEQSEVTPMGLIDTPYPDYYELFHERVRSKYYKSDSEKSMDKGNYKTAMNKRVKYLKTKLRELIA